MILYDDAWLELAELSSTAAMEELGSNDAVHLHPAVAKDYPMASIVLQTISAPSAGAMRSEILTKGV